MVMDIARRSSLRLGPVLLGLLGASIAFGACGSSKPPPTTTTTAVTTPATTIKTTAACTPALLTFTPVFGGSAAGGSYYRFNATNTGPAECVLDGYPTLTFLAPNAAGGAGSGVVVPLTVSQAGPPPARVILQPSQAAQFLLAFTEVPVNGAGCTSVASVDIKIPNQTETTPVPVSFAPCGGVIKVYAFARPGTENP